LTLDVSVISEAAKEEAEELQAKLLDGYRDESVFSVTETKAEEIFADFPYFRMVSFEKSYPNRLVIAASEDAEVFAVETEEEYYILGSDGTVLGIRSDASNRSDGKANVILVGLSATGERGQTLTGDDNIPALLSMCRILSTLFGGLRSNLVSVEVVDPISSLASVEFHFKMREGVSVTVINPLNQPERKASALASAYLNMKEEERLGGVLVVADKADSDGELNVTYGKNS
jgi:hypothetical protein